VVDGRVAVATAGAREHANEAPEKARSWFGNDRIEYFQQRNASMLAEQTATFDKV
jgi:hypothetical protein